jgi:hypothetical protein
MNYIVILMSLQTIYSINYGQTYVVRVICQQIIRTASDLSTIQFRLIFKGHKSLEYWCLVIHLTSVSTISLYAESNGVAFFSKYKAAQPNVRNIAICEGCCFHVEIPCKIV